MNEIKGGLAEVKMTINVTRKDTGKVETFDLVGIADLNEIKKLEEQNGSNSQHSS